MDALELIPRGSELLCPFSVLILRGEQVSLEVRTVALDPAVRLPFVFRYDLTLFPIYHFGYQWAHFFGYAFFGYPVFGYKNAMFSDMSTSFFQIFIFQISYMAFFQIFRFRYHSSLLSG